MSLRLRSVTLRGFKSFGETVRLGLSPRINAVVGPNGSGKSNVVEGIRWASHTARARELRARAATELIFHGSSGKAPLGLAEVELELEGLAGAYPLTVARRLYRGGEAELELGGRPALVRELHEVLRGSGLGPGGLAVVGQGEVGAVVSADPPAMLGYLEEAAGLSRASHRRAQTADRLEAAGNHLAMAASGAADLRAGSSGWPARPPRPPGGPSSRPSAAALERAVRRHRLGAAREELDRLDAQLRGAEVEAAEARAALELAAAGLEGARREREARQEALGRASVEAERLLGRAGAAAERAAAARRGSNGQPSSARGSRARRRRWASRPPRPRSARRPRTTSPPSPPRTSRPGRSSVRPRPPPPPGPPSSTPPGGRGEALERERALAAARQAALAAERGGLERDLAETLSASAAASEDRASASARLEVCRLALGEAAPASAT
jgi:chromosome segregation protein